MFKMEFSLKVVILTPESGREMSVKKHYMEP